jgi:hypothetical protein
MKITVNSIFRDQEAICDTVSTQGGSVAQAMPMVMIATAGMAAYGFAMGAPHSIHQGASSAAKLPMLFGLTLAITLPAFHFIGLHLGSRTSPGQTMTLCANSMAVTGVLMASLAPIALFFAISGSSYPFMVLVHVITIAFCASAGASTLSRSLERLRRNSNQPVAAGSEWCFPFWLLLFAVVGTQLGYMMRPFVGSTEEFRLLNTEPGNFYEAFLRVIGAVLRGR